MGKVLIIQRDLGGGGAEKVLIDILNHFDYSNYQVTLLLIYQTGVYLEDINPNVIVKSIYNPNKYKVKILQSIYCRVKNFLYEKYPKWVYKYFIDKQYDIEIAFLEGESTKFLSKSTNAKSKKIAWIHTDIMSFEEKRRIREKSYYKNIDRVVCVSQECKQKWKLAYPEYIGKAKVIYNLIDVEKIREKAKERIENLAKAPIVIGVGRLVEEKRFDLLIRAHKALIDEGIGHKLYILGEGNERENLLKLCKELNVQMTVHLKGFIKNPYPYIQRADVFVLPSDIEGFSLVVCEAISLGKAIVATKCTGPNELLENGTYGKLVDCGNYDALKDAIKTILENVSSKKYYEQQSVKKSKQFSVQYCMNQIYETFKE